MTRPRSVELDNKLGGSTRVAADEEKLLDRSRNSEWCHRGGTGQPMVDDVKWQARVRPRRASISRDAGHDTAAGRRAVRGPRDGDGERRTGAGQRREIRAWQRGPGGEVQYTTEVFSVEGAWWREPLSGAGRIDGNSPADIADLQGRNRRRRRSSAAQRDRSVAAVKPVSRSTRGRRHRNRNGVTPRHPALDVGRAGRTAAPRGCVGTAA